MPILTELPVLPQDPIYGMQLVYKNDVRPSKINLSIGVLQDPDGRLTRFQAVEQAIDRVHKKRMSKEYLPLAGYAPFCTQVGELVCGSKHASSLFCMQTVGGTGALYVAAKLLLRAGVKEIHISSPSWPNHRQLFEAAGLIPHTYPYYDKTKGSIDFDALVEAVSKMAPYSCILLQASCHNPTGMDLDMAQWKKLSTLLLKQKVLPFFDLAYQGFGVDVEQDAASVRLFLDEGHELLCATTLAKSLGLYNDRVGALMVHSRSDSLDAIGSHVKIIARTTYSSPPAHGVHIAATLLEDEELKRLWLKELASIRKRLDDQRMKLSQAIQKRNPAAAIDHIKNSKGLFCLFDLPEERVIRLREEKGIYIASDGRVCVAAITDANVDTIAEALYR